MASSGKYTNDRVDLLNDFLTITFAGHDTTAHTLAFSFAEISRHPDVQQKLFEEARRVLGPPPIDPATVTSEKLSRLHYTTAVYKEAMRMYPAVVFIPVHANEDIVADGQLISAGLYFERSYFTHLSIFSSSFFFLFMPLRFRDMVQCTRLTDEPRDLSRARKIYS
jgi:cytochrome P450